MVFIMYGYAYARLPQDIAEFLAKGNYKATVSRINWLLRKNLDDDLRNRLLFELERIKRIKKDYNLDESEARELARKELGDWGYEHFDEFVDKGYVDYIMVEGKRYFFRAFIDNILFLCEEPECKQKYEEKLRKNWSYRDALINHVNEIVSSGLEGFVFPRNVRVKMTLRLPEGTVEPNEMVRCWLPYPIESKQQPIVRLIATSHKKYYIAPKDHPQRTIYFEIKATDKGFVECWVEYEYQIKAFYQKINPSNVLAYDEDSELYQKYTREQPPHIVFTRRIRQLANEIVGDEQNPYLKARKIYDWIAKNMTYTYVSEYCLYESIAEYVARNLRGDCGFHAILFITLTRAVGIPAKWQSGWYANPAFKGPSPHDWTQFYIEPYGWLFADLSFARFWRTKNSVLYDFYFGNIDNFRTVFNEDLMGNFDPPKKFFRSDPVDNQRGEAETERGNIYYDKIKYEITYT